MPMVIGMVTRPDLRAVLSSCLMGLSRVGGAAKDDAALWAPRGSWSNEKSHDENGFCTGTRCFLRRRGTLPK